jgi:hypothetical protein
VVLGLVVVTVLGAGQVAAGAVVSGKGGGEGGGGGRDTTGKNGRKEAQAQHSQHQMVHWCMSWHLQAVRLGWWGRHSMQLAMVLAARHDLSIALTCAQE